MSRVAIVLGTLAALSLAALRPVRAVGGQSEVKPAFRTSDRCVACHNELTTSSGKDVSIGINWRTSVMANSSRDPYWQASVRRESIDHPQIAQDIEDECSVCHMPVTRYQAKVQGKKGEVFAHLPFNEHKKDLAAHDGVTCSVCHQISKEGLGTRASFNGGFVVESPDSREERPEYGPFAIEAGKQHIMQTSTGGFHPEQAEHIRDSALCGSCHQLYTTAHGANGEVVGTLPEQMPYLEWLHSDYPAKSNCQGCHMPEVQEPVRISSVLGDPRSGLHQHLFLGGNFLLQKMLAQHHDELNAGASVEEFTNAAQGTIDFLRSQSAKVSVRNVELSSVSLSAEVVVENLGGHKLPTAYPSRRVWLHFKVRDREGKLVFESGALNADGSIQGNDNDADPAKFEAHYREITSPEQVEIYESILGDVNGHVTTGLLSAVGYLKDNRLLPSGFDKSTADKDIAVVGDAAEDRNFNAARHVVRYSIPVGAASGPFHIEVELLYQPVGFRWAHNLSSYKSLEPQRFFTYYNSIAEASSTVLAAAEITY